jgi:multidrug efflux pump subunit AcrA (membrane-fusion protein)
MTSEEQVATVLSDPADGGAAYWPLLVEATSASSAAQPWLAAICAEVADVEAGILVLRDEQHSYTPKATWPPDTLATGALVELSEVALDAAKGTVRKSAASTLIAYPVKLDAEVYGVVCLSVKTFDMNRVRVVMRQLQWGCGWLRDVLRKEHSLDLQQDDHHTRLALAIIGDVIEADSGSSAAHDLVHRLVTEFSLERACLGFLVREELKVSTISHSASFGEQMNMVRLIGEAMEEAIEQRTIIHYPMEDSEIPTLVRAHESLHLANRAGALLTIPLLRKGEPIGALVCECGRGEDLAAEQIDLIAGVAAYAGSLLHEKQQNDKHLAAKVRDSASRQYGRMVGKGYTGRKLAAALAIVLIALLSFAQGTYQVGADGVLEGEIQRSIVAPFDGFILTSDVSAGDYVRKGDIMASFDDRDLVLERLNWVSQKQEFQFEYNRALGSRNRADVNVFEARIAQADIQLEMLDQQLARTQLTAPFDGVVVAGDLSQSIGSSSRRGDVLFEIAPLDAYRLTLMVDESQIAEIKVGQQGLFLSGALPDKTYDFEISKITPVAKALEGSTVFEVEARLLASTELLRPGMDGLGKIDAGERNLLWIWTRSFTHWLRITFWNIAG